MTEAYSGALTCMYTMIWLKMPFVDIKTRKYLVPLCSKKYVKTFSP